jgi:hypothetical protein
MIWLPFGVKAEGFCSEASVRSGSGCGATLRLRIVGAEGPNGDL